MAVIDSRFIAGLEKGGVDIDRHVAELYQDMTFGYGIITEQVKSGKSYGLNADQLLNILQIIIPVDYLWDSIDVYLTVQHFADEIMKDDGLTLSDAEYEYYYEGYDALVRRELKERGAKYISVVNDKISDVVNISASESVYETMAWSEYFGSASSLLYNGIVEAVDDALYNEVTERDDFDYSDVWDFTKIVDKLDKYLDIYQTLSKESIVGLDKHECDIYFASLAVAGNTVYMTDDIAVEVERIYHYIYEGYGEALDILESIVHNMNYSRSLLNYDSINELFTSMLDSMLEDWYCGYYVAGLEMIGDFGTDEL